MVLNKFFRKKTAPVRNEIEVVPNTYLNVYADSQKEAENALVRYLGKEKAKTCVNNRSVSQYSGEKRGLEFEYKGEFSKDERVPFPSIPQELKTKDSKDSKDSKPVSAQFEPGKGIVVNIDLGGLQLPNRNQSDRELHEKFSQKMVEVLKKVEEIEKKLREREKQIEALQMRESKVVSPTSESKDVAKEETIKQNREVTRALSEDSKDYQKTEILQSPQSQNRMLTPVKYDLSFYSPNSVSSDRLAKNLNKMAKEFELNKDNYKDLVSSLKEGAQEVRNISKIQEKEGKNIVIPFVLPDKESTERLQQVLADTGKDLAKKKFGKNLLEEKELSRVSTEINREKAGLTNIIRVQSAQEKLEGKTKNILVEKTVEYELSGKKLSLDKNAEDKAFIKAVLGFESEQAKVKRNPESIEVSYGEKTHVLNKVQKEINPRGTLEDTVSAAKEVYGNKIAFASVDWSEQKKIRLQTPERLIKSGKAVQKLQNNGGLEDKIYALTEKGTIRDYQSQKDRFIVLTPKSLDDRHLPNELKIAAEKHFSLQSKEMGDSSKVKSIPSKEKRGIEQPGMGIGV